MEKKEIEKIFTEQIYILKDEIVSGKNADAKREALVVLKKIFAEIEASTGLEVTGLPDKKIKELYTIVKPEG